MSHPTTGLVLSGGGARGAYEVGVLRAIAEVLGPERTASAFQVFTGTSVGALNATWVAAHAERGDWDIAGLASRWRELRIDTHLRLNPLRRLLPGRRRATWSLLDVRALARLMTETMPWGQLHHNIDTGHIHALAVACLEVGTGRTVVFAETSPDVHFRPTRDPSRSGRTARITAEHILASTALPFLFPPRRIDGAWFSDGGLRFNTPLAPALRLGAERVVVISLLHDRTDEGPKAPPAEFPSPSFLAGKMLNALLLDPLVHDIQVMDRFNAMIDVLHEVLEDDEMARVDAVIAERRGLPYRKVERLVFRPSADIGELAATYVRQLSSRRPATALLTRAMHMGETTESDLLSFLLFDKAFVEPLLELGYADGIAHGEAIARFFA